MWYDGDWSVHHMQIKMYRADCQNFAEIFGVRKLESLGYRVVLFV